MQAPDTVTETANKIARQTPNALAAVDKAVTIVQAAVIEVATYFDDHRDEIDDETKKFLAWVGAERWEDTSRKARADVIGNFLGEVTSGTSVPLGLDVLLDDRP